MNPSLCPLIEGAILGAISAGVEAHATRVGFWVIVNSTSIAGPREALSRGRYVKYEAENQGKLNQAEVVAL